MMNSRNHWHCYEQVKRQCNDRFVAFKEHVADHRALSPGSPPFDKAQRLCTLAEDSVRRQITTLALCVQSDDRLDLSKLKSCADEITLNLKNLGCARNATLDPTHADMYSSQIELIFVDLPLARRHRRDR